MTGDRTENLRVAVRGDGDTAADAVASVDRAVRVDHDAEPDVVVATDETALAALADDPPSAAVVPSWSGGDPPVVGPSGLGRALAAVAAGEARVEAHPVVGVAVDDVAVGRALFDVTLVTSDPARISEYAVHAGDERLESVRADGMTVATPLGSTGYARAAGGPLLAPGTGLAVVPIAPFTTDPTVRVLRPELTISVERDERPVALVLDDAVQRRLGGGERVRVRRVGALDVAHVPTGSGGESEKF